MNLKEALAVSNSAKKLDLSQLNSDQVDELKEAFLVLLQLKFTIFCSENGIVFEYDPDWDTEYWFHRWSQYRKMLYLCFGDFLNQLNKYKNTFSDMEQNLDFLLILLICSRCQKPGDRFCLQNEFVKITFILHTKGFKFDFKGLLIDKGFFSDDFSNLSSEEEDDFEELFDDVSIQGNRDFAWGLVQDGKYTQYGHYDNTLEFALEIDFPIKKRF